MAANSLAEAEFEARRLVNKWWKGAAAVGWIPGSGFVLTPGDYVMCKSIASIFGCEESDAESVMAALAGSVAGKTAAELLSVIPVLGWAIKAGVAAATTKAIGEAVIDHYKSVSRLS